MFYGQCWKCGERWELGTASTCTCEPEQPTISFNLTDPAPKPVMTLSCEGIWVDPSLSVDEAAKTVLGAIDTQVKYMVATAVQAERDKLTVMFLEAHEGEKDAHNYWLVAANKIKGHA